MYIARTHTHKSSGNPILNGSVSSRQQASAAASAASAATFPALPNKRGRRHKYNPNKKYKFRMYTGQNGHEMFLSLSLSAAFHRDVTVNLADEKLQQR